MAPKEILLFHINSYWIYKLCNEYRAHPCITKQVYNAIENLGAYNWEEGFLLGESIYSDYIQTGRLSVPVNPVTRLLDTKYPGYISYLSSHIHAWAVPLSYSAYTKGKDHQTLFKEFDRSLNLFGSTHSHSLYFDKLVRIVTDHLVQNSNGMPKGFLDVGCGDGALLRKIKAATAHLNQGFFFVGVDSDDRSFKIAKDQNSGDIIFLKGDVSDPRGIDDRLREEGLPPLHEYFHLRAFVDHNFTPSLTEHDASKAQTAYPYYYLKKNKPVPCSGIIAAYEKHFSAWKKYIQTFGLGVVELHRIEKPYVHSTPSIAYEIFHLLSEQYVLTHRQFEDIARTSGWQKINSNILPQNEQPAISISIYK
jgi:hypothetical protein